MCARRKSTKMLARLKLILPGINVLIAAILLGVGYTRPIREWSPVPWQMALCFSINAPANILRYLASLLWDRYVYPNCPATSADTCIRVGFGIELVIFFLGAAFVWYVVALEIEAISRGMSAMAGLGIHARVVVNASLVAAGLLFLFLFMKNWGSSHLIMAPQYRVGILSCFAWALVIVIVCGRDLIRCAASEGQAQF